MPLPACNGRSASLSSSYRQLRMLRPGSGSGSAVVIAAVELAAAVEAAERHGLQEPCGAGNRLLLRASESGDDAAFLCLRCLVSEPLEQKVRAIQRERGREHGLDLVTLASFALDDSGELLEYEALKVLPEVQVRPFTAQVVCSFDGGRGANLPHWARTKLQACPELKRYLREHGVLLISTWALLADSSGKRVREALELFGTAALSIDRAAALHAAYCAAYKAAKAAHVESTGKQSGWVPDETFLRAIAVGQAADLTLDQLEGIDRAIRRLLTQRGMVSLEEQREQGQEPADPSSLELDPTDAAGEGAEQMVAIRAALDRAMEPAVRAAIEADRVKWSQSAERRLCWQLYGEGAGQRAIAEACGKGQAWVSKLLQEKELASAIATAAALELKRRSDFAAAARSVEGAERLVEALRNHLITPEREGVVAPLRGAVARVLAALNR